MCYVDGNIEEGVVAQGVNELQLVNAPVNIGAVPVNVGAVPVNVGAVPVNVGAVAIVVPPIVTLCPFRRYENFKPCLVAKLSGGRFCQLHEEMYWFFTNHHGQAALNRHQILDEPANALDDVMWFLNHKIRTLVAPEEDDERTYWWVQKRVPVRRIPGRCRSLEVRLGTQCLSPPDHGGWYCTRHEYEMNALYAETKFTGIHISIMLSASTYSLLRYIIMKEVDHICCPTNHIDYHLFFADLLDDMFEHPFPVEHIAELPKEWIEECEKATNRLVNRRRKLCKYYFCFSCTDWCTNI